MESVKEKVIPTIWSTQFVCRPGIRVQPHSELGLLVQDVLGQLRRLAEEDEWKA